MNDIEFPDENQRHVNLIAATIEDLVAVGAKALPHLTTDAGIVTGDILRAVAAMIAHAKHPAPSRVFWIKSDEVAMEWADNKDELVKAQTRPDGTVAGPDFERLRILTWAMRDLVGAMVMVETDGNPDEWIPF